MRSIFIVALVAAALWSQSLRERRGSYALIEHLKGEVRMGVMEDVREQKAIGGHFHLKSKHYKNFCFGATIEGVAADRSGELVGNKRNYLMLSELFVQYTTEHSRTKVGRIMVEWTPHADADDIRMIPNYFEGLHSLIERDWGQLELVYLTKMAGWESGGSFERFKSFDVVLGVQKPIEAFVGIGVSAAGWNVWGYYLDRSAWILYAAYEWIKDGWKIGVQTDVASDVGPAHLGSIEARSVGLYVEKAFAMATLYSAANAELGDGAMISFGGGPFYTSMEMLTLDMFGKNARSVAIGAEMEIFEATFGLMYGWFRGSRYQREIDIYATRKLPNGLNFDIVFANVQRENDLLRAIVKYSF